MNNLFLYFIKQKIYLFFILIISFVSLFFISLKIDGSTNKFLIQNDPEKVVYEKAIKLFGSDNSEVITIGSKDLFTYEKLSKIKDMIFELKKLDGVIDVDSLFNQKNIVDKNGELHNDVFIDPYSIPKDIKVLEEIKQDALNNKLVKGIFISNDGKYLFIDLRLRNDRSSEYSKYIATNIEKILDKYKAYFYVNQFGFPYINNSVSINIYKDLTFTIPLSILVILLIIFLNLKNLKLTFIPIITATLSIVITLGIMGFIGIKLTMLTSLIPMLIVLIGSTEDSHIISEYVREVQENQNINKDIVISIINKHIILAIFLTGITTFVGFFSIYFNDIIMLKEFALISSIGLIINFIITIIVVPTYLYYLDIDKIANARYKAYNYKSFLDLVEKFFYDGRKYVVFILIAIGALSFYFIPKVVIDDNIIEYFQKNSEIRKRADFMEHHLYGARTFYITFETDKKRAFKEYKYLHAMEKVKEYILHNSKFNFAASLADHISMVSKAFNGGNDNFYKVPKNRFLIDQYLMFFHRKDIKHYVTTDFSKANMVVWHDLFSSKDFMKEKLKLEQFIKNNIDPSIKVHIVGQSILIAKSVTTILKGEINSIFVILFTIFILMSIVFKNLKAGIVIVIANGLPILLVFISMVVLGIELNMVTAMVAAISFGIVVDDTIHILLHYKHDYEKTREIDNSIVDSIKKEGRAVILTSTYLAIGFLILITSTFIPVREYAILSVFAIIFALLSDLFITPTLIKYFLKEKK